MEMIEYSFLFLLHCLLLQTTYCIQSSKLTKWARWNEKNVTFGTPIGSEKSVALKTCFVKCQEISGCLSLHFNETNSTCEFSAYYPPARTVLPTPRTGWTVYHKHLACNVINPCQNGGTCYDGSYSNTCSCVAGYTGKSCETNINECSPNPCQNGGTCTDGINTYTCSCAAGYTETNCQTNINECVSYPCQNGGTCIDGVNSYTCSCVYGFTGTTCQTRVSVSCTGACTDVFMGFRLCNGSLNGECHPSRGRLEVYHDNIWGTICDDSFEHVDTKMTNAGVACRMFGYRYGIPKTYAYFGQGVGPMWLKKVVCGGSELSLVDCPFNSWVEDMCFHFEDVGVICSDEQ